MIDITNLLASDNYIVVNRDLMRELSLNTAIFLSELCAEYNYYSKSNNIDADGFFFSTVENIEQKTTLCKKAQATCIEQLTKMNLIEMKLKDLPAKRHFKLNIDEISKLVTFERKDSDLRVQQVSAASNYLDSNLRATNNNRSNSNRSDLSTLTTTDSTILSSDSVVEEVVKKYGKNNQVCLRDSEYRELRELYKDNLEQIIEEVDNWILTKSQSPVRNFVSLIKKFGNSYSKSNNNKSVANENVTIKRADPSKQIYTFK